MKDSIMAVVVLVLIALTLTWLSAGLIAYGVPYLIIPLVFFGLPVLLIGFGDAICDVMEA